MVKGDFNVFAKYSESKTCLDRFSHLKYKLIRIRMWWKALAHNGRQDTGMGCCLIPKTDEETLRTTLDRTILLKQATTVPLFQLYDV
jgi:hypothetical protein